MLGAKWKYAVQAQSLDERPIPMDITRSKRTTTGLAKGQRTSDGILSVQMG